MRRLLAALTVLSLAGTAPAHADPAVRVVTVVGAATDVTITCDVSSYPAALYPCPFDLTVRDGCLDVTAANACTLSVRGTLYARPGDTPSENCAFSSAVEPVFDDLAWDCRRNDGGDPTSSGAGIDPNPLVNSSAINPNPVGAFVFTRV